ncbi:MAG: malto-oligosyltrehalose synthase [Elainella sp. C42_A2020_010]|nr:malto-oligosyltrehalose synthase [Elainella sp. C42_A2020_010]RNJ68677.1 MAG: malto-oligosyltrehalose synthase [Leptolyngbya sp. IPPAS B-1204]
MRIPQATYRIQFTADFGFDVANQIVDYLTDLGISDLYASPIFKARAGSTHGYDVVDPTQINPELGTEAAFEQLVQSLQQRQMGWLQDIVPNHMAYDSANRWLMDVLENGPASNYVNYFDIAWNSPFDGNHQPILVPLLGNFYGECLENGEIQLRYDQAGLTVNYYSLCIPLRLESYATFLTHNLGKLAKQLGRKHPVFVRLLGILYSLKSVPDLSGQQRLDQTEFVKGLLWDLYLENQDVKAFIDENIQTFNGEPGDPDSFNWLDGLLSEQFFRLAFWKVGAEEMNYRRFFTVNELISVKVEEIKVFHATHALIFKLIEQGMFTGLRIDHIDGLYNPTQYLEWLQEKVGDTYITVEKILQPGEDLPQNWSIQGTSGYDYLNYVNGIFCQTENQAKFDQIYWQFTGRRTPFEELVAEKKQLILDKNLAGDVDNLAVLLKQISNRYRYGNDFTINGLKRAIAEVLTRFPVYRTYTNESGLLESDRIYIEQVIQAAKDHAPLLQHELDFIEKLLLLEYDSFLTSAEKDQWLYLVMRLQQYTGPLMAKGVEDTALYVYNRLLSLNEVGGEPSHFGLSIAEFHDFNRHRQAHWPHTMNATSTHDTKRGEDVRARLNVLSELPQEWQQQVQAWSELNQIHKTQVKQATFPDSNDEYALYQTLVGAYPFVESEQAGFVGRVKDYMLKSIREAKLYTTWLRNNPTYEEACLKFVDAILATEDNPFLQAFLPFQHGIAHYGVLNSLSQTLLKLTSPGVPDFYQGSELWDLSLVDPDNRRPIDFAQRQTYLAQIKAGIQADVLKLISNLLANPANGKIKLFLIVQALKARNEHRAVFQIGDYQPLEVEGPHKNHIIAFARRHANSTVITIAPRYLTSIVEPGEYPLGSVWGDTYLQLPDGLAVQQNLITAESLAAEGKILIAQALQHFPVALLAT